MLDKIMLIVGIVFAVIKGIAELIKIVETPGFGKEKKETVLKIIGTLYDELQKEISIPISKERVLSIAGTAIDILVAFYNLVGIFRPKDSAPAPSNNS